MEKLQAHKTTAQNYMFGLISCPTTLLRYFWVPYVCAVKQLDFKFYSNSDSTKLNITPTYKLDRKSYSH